MMKQTRILAAALCLLLLLTGCGGNDNTPAAPAAPAQTVEPSKTPAETPAPEADPETEEGEEWEEGEDEGTVITVSTVEEFAAAIGDNTTILLEPGVYDVSEWLWSHEEIPAMEMEGRSLKGVINVWNQFGINEVKNLTITSADIDSPAEIVSQDAYSQVLTFYHCDDLELGHVTVGHAVEPGTCSGDVIGLTDCRYTVIYDCNLYGCGAYALNMDHCWDVVVADCYIHDCTYGCAQMYSSREVKFFLTDFRDCRQFTMFEARNHTDVRFEACDFVNLDGDLFYADDWSWITLENCYMDDAAQEFVDQNKENLNLYFE